MIDNYQSPGSPLNEYGVLTAFYFFISELRRTFPHPPPPRAPTLHVLSVRFIQM